VVTAVRIEAPRPQGNQHPDRHLQCLADWKRDDIVNQLRRQPPFGRWTDLP
jgi:hypothetical protein